MSKHIFFIKCRRQHFRAIRWSMYTKFTFIENTGRDFLIAESANFLGNRLLFFISIKTLQEPFCSNCYILLVKKELLWPQHKKLTTIKMNKVVLKFLLRNIYVNSCLDEPRNELRWAAAKAATLKISLHGAFLKLLHRP